MFVAHAPAGWLTARMLRGPLERRLGPMPALTAAAVAGALAPDLDLLLWLADPTVHHHAWPTHWPLAWAALGVALVPALLHARVRRVGALGLVFAGNGLLHQVLDTMVGDVRWLAPLSDGALSLFVVQRVHEPWWLNFLLHPTFLVEVALVTAAAGLALTARHPVPRYVGWMPEALRWMRDWALLGGITCAVAPSVASLGPFPLVPEAFCATAAVLGTLTGAAVGLFLYGLTLRTPERSRVAVAAVVWPPVLGGWGAAVSASAASLSAPGMELLAVFCGSVAALLQAAWFAPAYARQAGRKGWRWPLLGLALVTSWGAGLVAVSTVFGFMDLL